MTGQEVSVQFFPNFIEKFSAEVGGISTKPTRTNIPIHIDFRLILVYTFDNRNARTLVIRQYKKGG